MLQSVITPKQARQITKGRTPLVPIEYEQAIKALTECTTFDEAKYWDSKADALAAWAKIYHSNEYLVKAKRLKLHAYRRIGELANDLRPNTGPKKGNSGAGRLPGAVALLRDYGFKKSEAAAARRLALLSQTKFNSLLKKPNAPTTTAWKLWGADPLWQEFSHSMLTFRAFCKRRTAAEVAALLTHDGYAATARQAVIDITEWLDDFEMRLPKGSASAKAGGE